MQQQGKKILGDDAIAKKQNPKNQSCSIMLEDTAVDRLENVAMREESIAKHSSRQFHYFT
jgi:hypothetical protein